jgi:hypothetical protein
VKGHGRRPGRAVHARVSCLEPLAVATGTAPRSRDTDLTGQSRGVGVLDFPFHPPPAAHALRQCQLLLLLVVPNLKRRSPGDFTRSCRSGAVRINPRIPMFQTSPGRCAIAAAPWHVRRLLVLSGAPEKPWTHVREDKTGRSTGGGTRKWPAIREEQRQSPSFRHDPREGHSCRAPASAQGPPPPSTRAPCCPCTLGSCSSQNQQRQGWPARGHRHERGTRGKCAARWALAPAGVSRASCPSCVPRCRCPSGLRVYCPLARKRAE